MTGDVRPDERTILVVDDDPQVLDLVSEYLRDFGYHVLEAPSGRTALSLLDHEARPDLVITDVRMPGMSGLELAAAIAQRGQHVKIVFMSGYYAPQLIHEPLLRKPFRLAELETMVRAQLGT